VFDDAALTTRPVEGAGAVSVIVPVAREPPTTFDGCTASVESVAAAAGCTVSDVLRLTPAYVAVTLAVVVDATALVVIAKVAVVAPAPMPAEAGTSTDGWFLASATSAPAAGAGADSDTVPVALAPPVTLAGATLTALRAAVAPRRC